MVGLDIEALAAIAHAAKAAFNGERKRAREHACHGTRHARASGADVGGAAGKRPTKVVVRMQQDGSMVLGRPEASWAAPGSSLSSMAARKFDK